MIDFLISSNELANLLRDRFVFHIVPMLNPDGVKYGNYRCSIFGGDLNRKYIDPHEFLHTSIFHVKKMIKDLQEKSEIYLLCDVHGHSRAMDAFMYGCNFNESSLENNTIYNLDSYAQKRNLEVQKFPLLFSLLDPKFELKKCQFNMSKDKFGTARIVAFRDLQINLSYTLEASLYSSQVGSFSLDDYHELGRNFMLCLELSQRNDINNDLVIIQNFRKNLNFCNDFEQVVCKKLTQIKDQYPFNQEENHYKQILHNQILISQLQTDTKNFYLPQILCQIPNSESSLMSIQSMQEKRIYQPKKKTEMLRKSKQLISLNNLQSKESFPSLMIENNNYYKCLKLRVSSNQHIKQNFENNSIGSKFICQKSSKNQKKKQNQNSYNIVNLNKNLENYKNPIESQKKHQIHKAITPEICFKKYSPHELYVSNQNPYEYKKKKLSWNQQKSQMNQYVYSQKKQSSHNYPIKVNNGILTIQSDQNKSSSKNDIK